MIGRQMLCTESAAVKPPLPVLERVRKIYIERERERERERKRVRKRERE